LAIIHVKSFNTFFFQNRESMINAVSTKTIRTTPLIEQQQPLTVVSSNPLENQLRQALVEPHFSRGSITQADVTAYLNNTAYVQARADYENNLLPLPGMVAHARNTMAVTQEINKLRAAHPNLDENAFQNLLGEKLTGMLMGMKENKQLDLSQYQAKNNHKNGYAKFLLYSNSNTPLPYCLQLFVFLPKQTSETQSTNNQLEQSSKLINHQRGQRTKLHNHIAPCASSVLQGTLEETVYCPIDGFRKNSPLAVETDRRRRETGSTEGFDEQKVLTSMILIPCTGLKTLATTQPFQFITTVKWTAYKMKLTKRPACAGLQKTSLAK
jgi:hypothetical protein